MVRLLTIFGIMLAAVIGRGGVSVALPMCAFSEKIFEGRDIAGIKNNSYNRHVVKKWNYCFGRARHFKLYGGTYEGEWKNGQPHWHGKFTFPDGKVYIGRWEKGQKHGKGIINYKDGRTEKVEYSHDYMVTRSSETKPASAQGSEQCPEASSTDSWNNCTGSSSFNGGNYTGLYKKGRPHGQGVWTSPKGEKSIGKFVDGVLRNGKIASTWSYGKKFEWDVKRGTRTGWGVKWKLDGSRYTGELKNTNPHGRGTYSGRYAWIDGQWENGQINGKVERIDYGRKALGEEIPNAERDRSSFKGIKYRNDGFRFKRIGKFPGWALEGVGITNMWFGITKMGTFNHGDLKDGAQISYRYAPYKRKKYKPVQKFNAGTGRHDVEKLKPSHKSDSAQNWDNCYGTHKDIWGMIYHGEWRRGKFHGHGELVKKDPKWDRLVRETLYQGQFKDNKFHGVGTEILDPRLNFFSYIGEWKSGERTGYGFVQFLDGGYYSGDWKAGKFHGRGWLIKSTGEEYFGGFKNGKYHDHGFLTYADGRKYHGMFSEGKYHGTGILYLIDGGIRMGKWKDGNFVAKEKLYPIEEACPGGYDKKTWTGCIGNKTVRGRQYRGMFLKGRFHGHGAMRSATGEQYIGEFENGEPHGAGTFIGTGTSSQSKGIKYVGDFKRGQFHGSGVHFDPELFGGGTYFGHFRRGKKSGDGLMLYRNGNIYEGSWENDKQGGQFSSRGTMIGGDRNKYSKYIGKWKDGKYHGSGFYILEDRIKGMLIWCDCSYRNGKRSGWGKRVDHEPKLGGTDLYRGEWKEGKKHGRGRYEGASGLYSGEWKEGKRHGWGRISNDHRYGDGSTYIGQWKNGKKHGLGIHTFKSGTFVNSSGNWNSWNEGNGKKWKYKRLPKGTVREGIWENGKFVRAEKLPEALIPENNKRIKIKEIDKWLEN